MFKVQPCHVPGGWLKSPPHGELCDDKRHQFLQGRLGPEAAI